MMPSMWNADGQNRTRVGTVVTQGQGWNASWNLIRHIAKVERGQRVAGGAKAISAISVEGGQRVADRAKAGSAVTVEGGQRVASVIRIGSVINTNPIDQEFGCHSVNERCLIGPRGVPHKSTYGAPGTQCLQMTCPNS